MHILGISAFYHDSAACLVRDGTIVAAAEEERFTRLKHDNSFPAHAISYCLNAGATDAKALDLVVFYDKPFLKFERILETALAYAPRGFGAFAAAVPSWLNTKLWVRSLLRKKLGHRGPVLFPTHHLSHAASAFYPSPFNDAAVLTVDGVGEWATTTYGVGSGNRIELLSELHFPHSLGLLYSAFTAYLGFTVNDGECKVMGLASYGQPAYRNVILDNVLDLRDDGSFALNMDYFTFGDTATMTNRRFDELLGGPPRVPDSEITPRHTAIARSVQAVIGEAMLRTVRHVHRTTGQASLCLAGGVALNCVANGRIVNEGPFENVWIQPAAGDAGGAIGAALLGWYDYSNNARQVQGCRDSQVGSLLGPEFGDECTEGFLRACGARYRRVAEDELLRETARRLGNGEIVAWFQGRMEFGPRALGNRSILADPRSDSVRARLNERVKFREPFRPFAPAVLGEECFRHFALGRESPYMLIAAPVQPRRAGVPDIPAVTHIDGTARVQTVHPDGNPRFRALIETFYHECRCPVLLNTSLNVRGEPIASSPRDAYRCFVSSDIDMLVMGNHVVDKRPVVRTSGHLARWVHFAASCARRPDGAFFTCPSCEGLLVPADDALGCPRCERRYAVDRGIPRLYMESPTSSDARRVEQAVRGFYDEHPFPGYEEAERPSDLLRKARGNAFLQALDKALDAGQRVLEVGCGTGQLSNYLGLRGHTVAGADLSLAALRLADSFRQRAGLDNVGFVHMNLFRPAFVPGAFSLVICNGVLHHTADPMQGLLSICRLIAPGGHLILGLYNRYGRLFHHVRQLLSHVPGVPVSLLDPHLRRREGPRRTAWFADQYRNPHESTHTCAQVYRWFAAAGLEPVRALMGPPPQSGDNFFARNTKSNTFADSVEEFACAVDGIADGGLFIVVGRKVR
jgi:carbamoyltransferase